MRKTFKVLCMALVAIMTLALVPTSVSASASATVQLAARSPGQYRAHAPNSGILNMRANPNTSASIVASIPHNTVLNVTQISGVWGLTTFNGRSGWIHLDHAQFLGGTQQPASQRVRAFAPTSGILNMRANPNTSASIVASIPHNTLLTITERNGVWGRTTFNGRSGWVHMDHVRADTGVTQPPVPSFNPAWPTVGGRITSGDRHPSGNPHSTAIGRAVDIDVGIGTAVFATEVGTVTTVDNRTNIGMGRHVIIQHDNGARSLYAHLSVIHVQVGQRVGRGQHIANSGNTGTNTTGAHLHFELTNSTRDRMADFFPGR